ncbi:HS12A-like protein, partial [Mya arenaria]
MISIDQTVVTDITFGLGYVLLKGGRPTCVLIKPDGITLEAFGYEAETIYADLAAKNEHKKWYYFRRFKMKLFDKETLTMSLEIEDEDGNRLKASKVFALSIRYLKEDLIKTTSDKLSGDITENDIHWVITVPAIWSEPAKKFMRETAREAGIPFGQLSICLEPEAASIYCRHLPMERSSDTSVSTFKPGTKYLVLDAGGGTVDITVHKITQEGKLKELLQASGGEWGGTKIDDAFLELFNKIAGADIIERLKKENMDDYLELVRNFEVKKRDIIDKAGITVIRIPISVMEIAEEMTGKTFKHLLQDSSYKESIHQDRDKLKFDISVLVTLFSSTIKGIISHVQTLLQSMDQDCQAILMVGGFSHSKLLQERVKTAFHKHILIVPPNAGLAVLKGAVAYGHNKRAIVSRIARYTFGLETYIKFDPKKHPVERKFLGEDNKPFFRGVFSELVRKGETVEAEKGSEPKCFDPPRSSTHFICKLFFSTENSPEFVDDEGCNIVGEFDVHCVDKFGKLGGAIISLLFGGTEIEARAVLESSLEE